ncbi:MAG: AAA family ATPase [Rhodopila sp.]|nr:AAA family ATPase [Rhodopila sp.]
MTRRILKVGVAGTHSTGKSTLLSSLKAQLEANGLRVTIVKDLARAARDAGFPILSQQTEDTALWIMAEGIRREAAAALTSDVILVDRAIFDAFGYLEAALQVTGRPRNEERHLILEELARSYARDYDLLVITKLDEALALGAGRDPDEVFRRAAGERILAFAADLDRSFITMTSENSGAVKREILTFIRDRLDTMADA